MIGEPKHMHGAKSVTLRVAGRCLQTAVPCLLILKPPTIRKADVIRDTSEPQAADFEGAVPGVVLA